MSATQIREIFPEGLLALTLERLVHQLLERHPNLQDTCLLALQPRGVYLGRRIVKHLASHLPTGFQIDYGELDITFHRDDFRRKEGPLLPNQTSVNFFIEGRNVILIDDVLFTGRTVRAAMDAMLAFGRPAAVELMVLVDRRRQRHLPISPDYIGTAVETIDTERVLVEWTETHGKDTARIERLPQH
jgi:pyrimidine operon attenuation protein/uracil phosphoribosyltransferase